MGSGVSVQNEIPKEWMDIFKAMKLRPREVQKLYNIYNTVDADRSGSIDVTELLMFMDIERSLFTQRIFEAFDKDHTHRVDFYEFVVSAWKFCALGKEATCVFAFDLYDLNADGKLTSSDVVTMFRELLGAKALEQEAISRVLAKLMKEAAANDDFITVDFFRTFTNVHQALLLPVFGIQNMLRISTLGVAFWDRMSRRKIELRPGIMVPLSELMVLHAHRKLFGAIMENKHAMGRVSSMMRIVLDNTNNAVQEKTPPSSLKITLRNTKILNPFAGITKAVVPVAPVMVHGNFVSSSPASPTSSYRISVVGGGGVGAGLGGGGLGGVGYGYISSNTTSPRSVTGSAVAVPGVGGGSGKGSGKGSGSGTASPTQTQSKHHSPHTSPHNNIHGSGHSSGHTGENHAQAHSTHTNHTTHTTSHSGGSGSSSHGHASTGHNHSHSHTDKGDGHHHHHSNHNSANNKEHSHHSHHSSHHSHHGGAEHSSARTTGSGGSGGSSNNNNHHSPHTHSHSPHTHSSSGHTNSPHTKQHLTPAQLLQSHPHAKRTATDKPPL